MDVEALSKLMGGYLMSLKPMPTPRAALATFENPEKRVQDFVSLVLQNQLYHDHALRLGVLQDRIKSWFEDEKLGKDVDRIILTRVALLLGKGAMRNLILATGIGRLMQNQPLALPRKKADKYSLNVSDTLKFANLAEAHCENREWAFTSKAYEAGLLWDVIRARALDQKAPKDVLTALDTQWVESLKVASVSYELASTIKNFHFAPHAFGAGLLIGLGKVLMTVQFPKDLGEGSYATFSTEVEKYKSKRLEALWLLEKKKFPVTHEKLASLVAGFSLLYTDVEQALYFCKDPNFLKRTGPKELYQLAVILHLSCILGDPQCGPIAAKKLDMIAEMGLNDLGLSRETLNEKAAIALTEKKG